MGSRSARATTVVTEQDPNENGREDDDGEDRDDHPRAAQRAAAGAADPREVTVPVGPGVGTGRRLETGAGGEVGAHRLAIRPRRTSTMKNGTPTTAVMMPAWTSVGCATSRPDDIGREQERGTGDEAHRDDPAVVGPDDEAGDVRHDEPQEADGAGEGGRGAAQHGDADGDRGPGQDDVLADAAGEVVAERERVELADGEEHDDEADHEEGQHGDDEVEAAPADRPDLPEAEESKDCLLDTSRPDDQLASPAVTAAPARVRRRGVTPPPASPARACTTTAASPAPAMAHQT